MVGTKSSLDTESLFHFRVSTVHKMILSSSKSRFLRRVLQEKCARNYSELLIRYRQGMSNEDILKFYDRLELVYGFKRFTRFLFFWSIGFIQIWQAYFSSKPKIKAAALFDCTVESLSSKEVFGKVLTNILRPALRMGQAPVICLAGSDRADEDGVTFVKRIPYDLLHYADFGISGVFRFYYYQFSSLFTLIRYAATDLSILNISSDFISWPYIRMASHAGLLKTFIKTTSDYNFQPFWLELDRSFDFYTLWYSLNTKCFQYSGYESHDSCQYSLSYFDKGLTWANWHKDWLLSNFPSMQITVSPPIIFGAGGDFKVKNKRSVVLFDVSPRETSFLDKLFVDVTNFYYRKETAIKFLEDVVEACRPLGVDIFLKTKRKGDKSVAPEYIDVLERFERRGDLILTGADADVSCLIEQTILSISIPFTSTNYVASYLNKPSIYYDPNGCLEFVERGNDDQIYFINSKADLVKMIEKIVGTE